MSRMRVCAVLWALFEFLSSAQAQRLADDAQDFWVLTDGKTVAVARRDGVYRLEPNAVQLKRVYSGSCAVRGPLGGASIGIEDDAGFHVLDLESGKARPVLEGLQAVEVVGTAQDGAWCVVMGYREGPPPQWEFHQIDLRTLKARKVYQCGTSAAIELPELIEDRQTLRLYVSAEKEDSRARHRVDLRSLKATLDRVPSGGIEPGVTGSWTCPDGRTKVVINDGRLLADSGADRRDLGLPRAHLWAVPNREIKPDFLAVRSLSDTNKDGRIAREDGDLVEIHLVDLKTLKVTRLADNKAENIERDWSGDGRYLFWSRVEERYCLYAHDTVAGKTRKLAGVAGWCIPDFLLPDGRLIITVRDAVKTRLCLLDLNLDTPQPVNLREKVPGKWGLAGGALIFLGGGDDNTLNLLKLPPRTIAATSPASAPSGTAK